MQLRFCRSGRYAEHLGDLFVFVTFDIVQNENAACAGWKASDRLFQIEHVAGRERCSHNARVCVHPA